MSLARRAKGISPSATLAITAKAKRMRSEGLDVISFGAGEPDFDTPENIKGAAVEALQEGFTKYTPTSGIPELKEAICEKLEKDNNLIYSPEEILVSCGAKHSLFNAILALCDPGDEVIIPSPYWVTYPEQVKIAEGVPVFIETTEETEFKITAEKLKGAITPKTKLLILNSPSNPTGTVYRRQELQEIADIVVDKNIYVLSDEIYEKIIYDEEAHYSIAALGDEIKSLTVVINGVSKTYSMTGWRIGYAAGPREVIEAMGKIQDHSTSNPTSIAQKAALEALRGSQEELKKMVEEFDRRRKYIVERLNDMENISCLMPKGAFYVFPKVSKLFSFKWDDDKIIRGSFALTEFLLEKAQVAVVPGEGFGADEYIRLSYATSMENLVEGLNRIEQALGSLR